MEFKIVELKDEIYFTLAGGIILGRKPSNNDQITRYGPAYPWGNLKNTLKDSDISIFDLENTFTQSQNAIDKQYSLKTDTNKIRCLTTIGKSAVNLSNKHFNDFAKEGMKDTIENLTRHSVEYFGAGLNLDDALSGSTIQKNQVRLAMTGITDILPEWKATIDTPGTINTNMKTTNPEIHKILNMIRKRSQIQILYIYKKPYIYEDQEEELHTLSRKIIDSGIDIVCIHNSNELGFIERYNNGLIINDIGRLLDTKETHYPQKESYNCILKINAKKNKGITKVEIIPIIKTPNQINRPDPDTSKDIIKRINKMCAQYDTAIFEKDSKFYLRL